MICYYMVEIMFECKLNIVYSDVDKDEFFVYKKTFFITMFIDALFTFMIL